MEGVGDSVVSRNRPEKRVPIEAETNVCSSWGDKK
jgi:hypothetical protein